MPYDVSIGDPNTPNGLRKHLVRRFKGMRAVRAGYEPWWEEIARFCSPTTSRFIGAYRGQSTINGEATIKLADQLNSKLMDSRAVRASEVLANGMYSGLTSSARPWFKLTIADEELREYQAVKEWLNIVERRLYELFSRTDFYPSNKAGFLELGVFGNEAGLMERHWKYGLVATPLTTGEYWIGLDDGNKPDSLYRRCDMTVIQHFERFLKGREARNVLPYKVIECYDKGDYDTTFPVYHAIEPNDLRDPRRLDFRGKRFRSVYWSAVCSEQEAATEERALLAEEGFNSKPFWTGRWETRGGDIYASRMPGLNALADVRQLQLQVLRKQQGIDFAIKPALHGPPILNNMHAALLPGRITAMAGLDKDKFGAIWEVDARALQVLREDTNDTKQAVDEGFYVHLFNAITNMPGVQPRNLEEIAKRNEEQLAQLGPVTERTHQEKLKTVIDRGYDILFDARMIPEPPEELHGQMVDVEFISVLAQAQRLIGLGSIERTFGFASSVIQVFPGAADSLDIDAAMEEYGDITGIPATILRSKDAIAKLRQDRAQQEQAAKSAQMASVAAPAALDGAKAAEILYNSPGTNGEPNLASRLLGA